MAKVTGNIEKQPDEVLNIAFDFSGAVNSDTTISVNDVVVSSAEIAVANVVVEGQTVKMTLSGGETGQRYKVTVLVDTSDGETIEADGKIKVKDL